MSNIDRFDSSVMLRARLVEFGLRCEGIAASAESIAHLLPCTAILSGGVHVASMLEGVLRTNGNRGCGGGGVECITTRAVRTRVDQVSGHGVACVAAAGIAVELAAAYASIGAATDSAATTRAA